MTGRHFSRAIRVRMHDTDHTLDEKEYKRPYTTIIKVSLDDKRLLWNYKLEHDCKTLGDALSHALNELGYK